MILYSGYNGTGLLMDSQFWNLGSPISLGRSLVSVKIVTLLIFSPFFKFSFWMHWRPLGELQWWLILLTLGHAPTPVYRFWQSCEKYNWEGFSGKSGKLASLNWALPLCATPCNFIFEGFLLTDDLYSILGPNSQHEDFIRIVVKKSWFVVRFMRA